jgi:pyrroline-5-carboxylate reductase
MKILIIGGGNMGEAILKSLLRKRMVTRSEITVSEVQSIRGGYLQKKYGVNVTDDNRGSSKRAQVILLAVKPKELSDVLEKIAGNVTEQLVISIVAGYSMESINRKLKCKNLVRAMPNTPAQVGKGMTAWTSTDSLSAANRHLAQGVISALGEEHYFQSEDYIDMATAISGSGPAYVYLFIEAMVDAGVHIGLPRSVAEKLVIETILGSTEAMKKMSKHPAEMKNMVTSPGGTTTEALLQLESGGLRPMIINAVTAAYQKAKTLGTK